MINYFISLQGFLTWEKMMKGYTYVPSLTKQAVLWLTPPSHSTEVSQARVVVSFSKINNEILLEYSDIKKLYKQ